MNVGDTARALAKRIAWNGHASERGIGEWLARQGIPAGQQGVIVRCAVDLGLITGVVGLGGYVATKTTNTAEFGSEYAEHVER